MRPNEWRHGWPAADLVCAALAAAMWYGWPGAGGWPLLIGLLPRAVRAAGGRAPFKRTIFDFPLAVFLFTAGVGVWAAYDPAGGWAKFWVLVGAALLFWALSGQPRENLWTAAGLLGLLGAGLAGLFLLGQDSSRQAADFQVLERIGQGWASIRPGSLGLDFQPNLLAGILAILAPFPIAAGLAAVRGRKGLEAAAAVSAASLMSFALLLSSSRGAWLALAAGLAAWLAAAFASSAASGRFRARVWKRLAAVDGERWGTGLLAAGLLAAVLALGLVNLAWGRIDTGWAAGLAGQLPGEPSAGSRLELARAALYLAGDTAFTGGGLGAFPGLYAQYVRVIPFYLYGYSHNFFLDVALEQGMFGFLALAAIFLGSLALSLANIACLRGRADSGEGGRADAVRPYASRRQDDYRERLLNLAVLAGLVTALVHGLIDDPLYGGRGTPLVFALPALAAALYRHQTSGVSGTPRALAEEDQQHLSPPAGPFFTRSRIGPGETGAAGSNRWRWWAAAGAALALFAVFAAWRPLLAGWYANLGAVWMSRVELSGFPRGEWDAAGFSGPVSEGARQLFERALDLDPDNPTAAYRLGLIALAERDYPWAIRNLEIAHQAQPGHRGIAKNLGYSYVWSGQAGRARPLLAEIPEAAEEMEIYSWWWRAQGREDLAERAAQAAALFAEQVEEEE